MSQNAGEQTFHIFNSGPIYREKPKDELNAIDFSCYKQLEKCLSSKNFSIKYVRYGTEMHTIKDRNYHIGKDKYLLTNAFTDLDITIDSDQYVHGACMEISPSLLAEVLAVHHDPASPYPRKDYYDYLTTAAFFENSYDAGKTNLGRYLQHALPQLHAVSMTDDLYLGQFFYNLAEKLLTDQREVYRYVRSLDSLKAITRKDLLRRLLRGKELMDDQYAKKISIAEIARTAMMSEYYFLRLFKKTFNCSPHQYVIYRRLQKAFTLLHEGHTSVADVAYECGFTDIHTFSKAFKKRYGWNPSAVRKR
ncbi:MAG: AraC family transcriptional regulator [Flavipsychrobacter sp.]|jgi:AraC-like DNA-binding protein|nr:AraC family transcriptional regulator [Flavipsychrobacter sp.]